MTARSRDFALALLKCEGGKLEIAVFAILYDLWLDDVSKPRRLADDVSYIAEALRRTEESVEAVMLSLVRAGLIEVADGILHMRPETWRTQ